MARISGVDTSIIKRDFMRAKGVKDYDELTDNDKAQLQNLIEDEIRHYNEMQAGTDPQEELAARIKDQFKAEHEATSTNPAKEYQGFSDRFEEGKATVFACISGLIVGLFAVLSVNGKWISLSLMGLRHPMTLHEFTAALNEIGSITRYFSSSTTSNLNLFAIVATLSYWILLIGGIILIITAVAVLAKPKGAIEMFGNGILAIITTACAIIGLVFTVFPLISSGDTLGVQPLAVAMLIIAGIPAIAYRFL